MADIQPQDQRNIQRSMCQNMLNGTSYSLHRQMKVQCRRSTPMFHCLYNININKYVCSNYYVKTLLYQRLLLGNVCDQEFLLLSIRVQLAIAKQWQIISRHGLPDKQSTDTAEVMSTIVAFQSQRYPNDIFRHKYGVPRTQLDGGLGTN